MLLVWQLLTCLMISILMSGSLHIYYKNSKLNIPSECRAPDEREYLMIIFLIETIHCDPSYEPNLRDGSDAGSKHTFLCRINKNYP